MGTEQINMVRSLVMAFIPYRDDKLIKTEAHLKDLAGWCIREKIDTDKYFQSGYGKMYLMR